MFELIEKAIRDSFPDAVTETTDVFGIPNVKIAASSLLPICEKLHSDPELGFDYLADVTAIDWSAAPPSVPPSQGGKTDRIEVVYQLTNLASNAKVALRVDLDREKPELDTVTSVWKGADYQEREVYDLMGVVFRGHPDLRRILLPEDWEGYPLRKDYVIPD
jgi:NADH/F420H2 dehydrogenase subunit C